MLKILENHGKLVKRVIIVGILGLKNINENRRWNDLTGCTANYVSTYNHSVYCRKQSIPKHHIVIFSGTADTETSLRNM